ncbi:MAG TPA: helix-turn-helix transcriptional regulator [Ktedonobacterales bacterium]|jgi:transcriptional regulator with XRE-family HTH domain
MSTFKDLRERLYLSQSDLAKQCGVKKQAVWYWENGLALPSLAHQKQLVEVLQCTRDELLATLKEARERREQKEQPAA